MPVTGPANFRPINQKNFSRLDYQVMRLVFESQNHLGRLCDETIYQNDLLARLSAAGLSACKEIPVTVTHGNFTKTYWLDLVVENAAIYELKTTHALVGAHEAQLLNYLFLCSAQHGKLINFRPLQIESRFINARQSRFERLQFSIETHHWQERDPTDLIFRTRFLELVKDWGCLLDVALYTEAMIHFAGGENKVAQRLPLISRSTPLGTQPFLLLNPETAFVITALTEGIPNYHQHLRSLIQLSPLKVLQWINLEHHTIQFTSLTR